MPLIDFSSGYVQRAIDQFPRQGSRDPWQREQNHVRNRWSMRRAPIDDPALEFSRVAPVDPALRAT